MFVGKKLKKRQARDLDQWTPPPVLYLQPIIPHLKCEFFTLFFQTAEETEHLEPQFEDLL